MELRGPQLLFPHVNQTVRTMPLRKVWWCRAWRSLRSGKE